MTLLPRRTAAVLALLTAFGLGIGAGRLIAPAEAQPAGIEPMVISIPELTAAALTLQPFGPGTAGNARRYVDTASAQITVFSGVVPKHTHQIGDEIDIVVEGRTKF
jgi:hypothetical protein